MSRFAAASPEAATAPPIPDSTSIPYWSAAPAAPPPGTTRANALPASCEEITGPQRSVRRQTRWSSHMHARLAVSSTIIPTNHTGAMSASFGNDPNTATRLGASK